MPVLQPQSTDDEIAQAYQFFQTAPSASQPWIVRTKLEVGGPGGVFLVASLFNLAACINMATTPADQFASATTTRCDRVQCLRAVQCRERAALCVAVENPVLATIGG